MTIVRTLRRWLHRDLESDAVARAKRWAADRERYAVHMSDAEFEEMVKRDAADPAFQRALKEADELRQQGR